MSGSISALEHLFSPMPFCLMLLGTSLGILVGAIPGLTGAMLIALTLPLTFAMDGVDYEADVDPAVPIAGMV